MRPDDQDKSAPAPEAVRRVAPAHSSAAVAQTADVREGEAERHYEGL